MFGEAEEEGGESGGESCFGPSFVFTEAWKVGASPGNEVRGEAEEEVAFEGREGGFVADTTTDNNNDTTTS